MRREPPSFGWFGENLTVEGASSDAICFGDVWRVGEAVLQATKPRSPCYKLDRKVGLRNFAAKFRKSGRVGFYNRVLQEGAVKAGDDAEVIEPHPARASIRLLSDVRHSSGVALEDVERALSLDGAAGRVARLRAPPPRAHTEAASAVTDDRRDLPYWIAFSLRADGGAGARRAAGGAVRIA